MFSQSSTITSNCEAVQVDSRLAVADILSSMARDDQNDIKTYTSLNSFSTAVPTRTTPTFTPTTLRNIEETFLELQMPPMPTEHQNQAGFVPPVVLPPAAAANNTASSASSSPMPSYAMVNAAPAQRTGRNMGGRRPNRDDRLTPEEEERRRVRRERNKMAAARCRKRRLDHTNMLLNETDSLEGKRSRLQDEITDLEKQKEELQFILDAHKAVCKYQRNGNSNNNNDSGNSNGSCGGHHDENHHDVKPVIVELGVQNHHHNHHNHHQQQQQQKEQTRPARPVILPVRPVYHSMRGGGGNGNYLHEATGVAISTPSNGIINFDSMMEGGTGMTPISSGLTPMVPTCSHQQRSSGSDLSSPDSITPSKLEEEEEVMESD